MNEAIIISFSNADEAQLLQIPRIKQCTGRARLFPGRLNCRQFTGGRCRFSIGAITSSCCSRNSECADDEIDSRGAEHFTTWETTRNTPLWKRFEEHARKCHFSGDNVDSLRFFTLKCPKCAMTFDHIENFFDHSFQLLEEGYFCRSCRYPFDRCRSTIYEHCRQHHEEVFHHSNLVIINVAHYLEGGNLKMAAEDVITHNFEIAKLKKLQFSADGIGGSGSGSNNWQPTSAASQPRRTAADGSTGGLGSDAKLVEECSEGGKLRNDLPTNDSFWFDSSVGKLVCSRCDRLFRTKLEIKKHIWNAHAKRKCRSCSKSFNSYTEHHRVCVGISKPASEKPVAAKNGTINRVLDASLNVEGNSNKLIAKDVKPAKRAKLMSKLDLPDLIKTETSHLYPRECFPTPGTSNFVSSGLSDGSVELKPSSIDVNGDLSDSDFAQTSENIFSGLRDNLKLESSSGAADEPVFAPIKTEQDAKISSSLDFCDLRDVKVEPLDLDCEGPSIYEIPRITWTGGGDDLLDPTQSPFNLNEGIVERRDGVVSCCGIKMEDCAEAEVCDDTK